MTSPAKFCLFVILGLLTLSGISCKQGDSPAPSGNAPAEVESGPPTLHPSISRSEITRDYKNAILSFVLKYRNKGSEPVYLSPPFVKLLTAQGEEIPLFHLPNAKVTQIPAGEESDTLVRFWLEEKHLAGALTLHLGEEKIVLKSEKPFDLNSLENANPKTLSSVDWQ